MISEDLYISEIEAKAKRDALAAKLATEDLVTIDGLERALRAWWSRHYNRPMKDPMLDDYSLYDLMFEFFYYSSDTREGVANDAINEYKEEAEDLFKDFDDEEKATFGPTSDPLTAEEESFLDSVKDEGGWSMNEKDFA